MLVTKIRSLRAAAVGAVEAGKQAFSPLHNIRYPWPRMTTNNGALTLWDNLVSSRRGMQSE